MIGLVCWQVPGFTEMLCNHALLVGTQRRKSGMKDSMIEADEFRAKAERAFLNEREAAAILRMYKGDG